MKISTTKRIEFFNKLLMNSGNIKKSSTQTGLSRRTCGTWCKKLGLDFESDGWYDVVESHIQRLHDQREVEPQKKDKPENSNPNYQSKYTIAPGTLVSIRNVLDSNSKFAGYRTKEYLNFDKHDSIKPRFGPFENKIFQFRHLNWEIKVRSKDINYRKTELDIL